MLKYFKQNSFLFIYFNKQLHWIYKKYFVEEDLRRLNYWQVLLKKGRFLRVTVIKKVVEKGVELD